MIIRIAIVDDDVMDLEDCEETLLTLIDNKHIDAEITKHLSFEKLKAYAKSSSWTPDIVFMDIVFGDDKPDGVQKGLEINALWPECHIVYLTDYIMYASDVYRTKHSYFATKSQLKQRVEEIYAIVCAEREARNRKIHFMTGGQDVVLHTGDILLFERVLRRTRVILADREYSVSDKLSDIEQRVPSAMFCRCHNSFLVNLAAVKEMNGKEFILQNGWKVGISRKFKQETRDKFFAWHAAH